MGLRRWIDEEVRQLACVNRSDRPWEMPVAARSQAGCRSSLARHSALTILLAEAGQGLFLAPHKLMQERLVDTVVGALLGLAGAAAFHNPRFRAQVGMVLRRHWTAGLRSAEG